jgi:DNA-binding MarR family transcriptional regulator
VLGLGLGMTMQVLVLAAQNAVAYRLLGVATAGSTLFRMVGGSIGVAVFGAIFANRLDAELQAAMPPGSTAPLATAPAVIAALPPPLHAAYVDAFTHALTPVFLAAALVSLVAFALSWLIPEVPLRATADAAGIGESFATPHDDDSYRELERALSTLAGRDNRWDVYERLADRASLDLAPPALWLLARLGEREPPPAADLAARLGVPADGVAAALGELDDRDLVVVGDGVPIRLTRAGRESYDGLVAARRAGLRELLEGWDPDEHAELQGLLDQLACAFAREPPTRPAAAV